MTDMGIYHTTIDVATLGQPDARHRVESVMVDTGSEYSWLPAERLAEIGVVPVRIDRFETADGRILERPVGYMMVFAGGREAPTVVAFAQPGDMILLGALALEGMNLRVDLMRRELARISHEGDC
jgi:predicted aspartyl protease